MHYSSARRRRRPSLLASATAMMIAMSAGIIGAPPRASAAPPATGPQNVRVTSTGTGFANLAWDAPDWGGNVNGRYSVLINNGAFVNCTAIAATTCKVTGANAATVSLVVRALGDNPAEYLQSDAVQTTLLPPPDKPTAVSATASGDLRATVSWTAPASWRLNTVRKYDLLVDGAPHNDCRNLAAATTTCSFVGLLGSHSVKVRAVGNTGLSNDSDPAVTVKLVSAPGKPTDIHLTASDAGTGTIVWTSNPNGNLTPSFTVKVNGDPAPGCIGITSTTCSFEADQIEAQVVVTAIGDAPDLKTDSDPVDLTLLSPPDAPTNVHAVPSAWGVGSATVAWDAPSFNGSENNKYAVLVDGAVYAGCGNLDATQCEITGTPGTTVSVVVRAIGDVGLQRDSSPAVTLDLPDLPAAVTNIRVTARTLGHTRVEWDAPANWHQNNFSKTYTVSAPGVSGCTAVAVLYCDVTGGANTTPAVTVTAIGNSAVLHRDATLANVSIPDVPGVPVNVRSVATRANEADIVWDAPAWNNNTNRKYIVLVDGGVETCADEEAEACTITDSGTVEVEVQAVGDDAATLSSALSEAKSFALIAAPDGVVSTVTVTAPDNQATVTVAWPSLTDTPGDSWSGGATHKYRVDITAMPVGATLTTNGCAVLIDDATPTCSFDTDKGGTYAATVTAVNEAGEGTASTAGTADLVRSAPTGAVTDLNAVSTYDSGSQTASVVVTWDPVAADAWNGGTLNNKYTVSVDEPAGTTPTITGDCTGDLADVLAPTCTFVTDTPGGYTVHVTPKNEAGPGTEQTYTVFVATVVPSAAVTDLTVARVPGTSTVKVSWTKIAEAAWNGTTRHYDVQITPTPNDAGITDNTCADLATGDQTDTVECTFVTDKTGSYEVSVKAVNEIDAGVAETETQQVTLLGPSGAVTGLTAVAAPVTGVVNVTWAQLTGSAWNASVDRDYTVTVTGPAAVTGSDCTTVADSVTPSCSFTAGMAGAYEITVVPTSEAGDGTAAATTAHVVLEVPTGIVSGVQIAAPTTAGVVDLSWSQLTTGWKEAQTRQYTVVIGGGLNITANTCDVVADSGTPGCSFTVNQPGPFTVSVYAENEAGVAAGGTAPVNGTVVFKPTVTVADLTAVTAAPPNSSTVTVSWTQLTGAGWQGATSKKYRVTVAGPAGTVYTDNTCTTADADDSATPSCHFRGSISGVYTVTVNPVSEAGLSTATAASTTVTVVQKPVATVSGVKVLPEAGSGDVQVIWNKAKTADWNGPATTKQYVVTITGPNGASVTANDCTTVTEPTYPACTFSTDAGGDYTVHVALKNEAGVSDTPGTATAHLTLTAPVGQVGPVTATVVAGSGTVNLSWPALSAADWSEGLTKSYAVTIAGVTPSANTCTSVPATANPSCSFTVTTPGAFSVVVKAVNDAGTAATGGSTNGNVVFLPTATVTGLTAATTLGSATVAVSWDQLGGGAWQGGAGKTYAVTVTAPTGATLSNDTCTGSAVADSSTPGCAFDVSVGGDYVVQVAPKNEAGIGTAADSTAHVKLIPTVAVADVTVAAAPSSSTVNVSWASLAATAWNGGTTHTYAVTLQTPAGAAVTGSCTAVVADSATPSCSFTTDKPGAYTASVAAKNEAGTSLAAGTGNGTVVLTPTAAVTGLTASTTTGSPTVAVSWNQLSPAAWLGGSANTYAVTVAAPTGAALSNNSCTPAAVADSALPGCAFDASVGGDYVIQVAPKNEAGTGVAADATGHVTLAPVATVTGLQVTTTAGSPTVGVSWDRLAGTAWNGGSTHTYEVTLQNSAGATVTAGTCTNAVADSATPGCSFTTDRPGAYTVSVAPKNEAGAGTAVPANGTLGSAAPAAATGVSGAAGVNAIEVSWSAPVSTSFASVISLEVSATATGYPTASCTGPVTASPCTISDVAAGVPYTLHVTAQGPGGSTDATATATPTGLPVAPEQVPVGAVPVAPGSTTTGGTITITGNGFEPNSTVVLSLFSNPVDLGTTVADGTGAISVTVTLPSGTPTGSHTLLATGLDENGDVVHLAKSVAVAPVVTTPPVTNPPVVTPPQAEPPTGAVGALTVKQSSAGTRTVTVTWSAGQVVWNSTSNRMYRVTVDGPDPALIAGSCTSPVAAPATSCSFTTDLNGTYAIRVAAATSVGTSSNSTAATVTVNSAPAAPTDVTASAKTNAVTVSWTAPYPSGPAIRAYTVTVTAPNYPNRSCTGVVTRSPCTITGLAAGVRYTPWVVANGVVGNSPLASGKTTVMPTGSAQAPLSVPTVAVINISRSAKAGSRLAVTGTGYRPGSRVLLNLYPGGALLGTATASSTGTVSDTVTIPTAVTGGVAVLATGLDKVGQARYVKTPVRIVKAVAGVMSTVGGPTGKNGSTTPGSSEHKSPTTGQSIAGSSSTGAMALTGSATGPVMLAGLVILIIGLLLVVTTRKRRAARHG
ncbi:fibronectin type III domain-containing protein [Actinoplanes sp. Pm04-4]|uniref:Fibronectin type III domain-containing protein n=1 Tax=Paractinoplanes pyxinae TaxID=2997416 RepID=A0ABT4BGM3_9ACTN|nr:fibronectin type III domain-containing protein [Actinoplanes pyxinae]MCY1145683.1 fibronectin type III domain-containing protein [Actinoplanes pyxinae]